MAEFAKLATEFVWTLTGTRSEIRYDGWEYSFTEESAINPEYHAWQTGATVPGTNRGNDLGNDLGSKLE